MCPLVCWVSHATLLKYYIRLKFILLILFSPIHLMSEAILSLQEAWWVASGGLGVRELLKMLVSVILNANGKQLATCLAIIQPK